MIKKRYLVISDLQIPYHHEQAVKNLIKSFNKDIVELNPIQPANDDVETTTHVGDATTDAPVDTVSKMAKRAAKTRGAAI